MGVNNGLIIQYTHGQFAGGQYYYQVWLPTTFTHWGQAVFQQTYWEEYTAVGGTSLSKVDVYVSNYRNPNSNTLYYIIAIGY